MPQLVISDKNGNLYDVPGLEAAGMKGGSFLKLTMQDLIPIPAGSELFMLPGRVPVAYDAITKSFIRATGKVLNAKNKPYFPVAAFVSPGFTTTFNSAYLEVKKTSMLPLFSYAACAFHKGDLYAACVRTDKERRQDLKYIKIDTVKKEVERIRKIFPRNRLARHLERCALIYGCPAAKNFFLGRYEAPLPASPFCNARCLGCISYQPRRRCSVTQPRITFVPDPEELAEIALFHIKRVRDPVVSFGQGCEGEPLLVGDILEKAIKIVRQKTKKGVINLNTNASKTKLIGKLFDAGLNSMRVSLNSARPKYYTKYYKPLDYTFTDVRRSIEIAKKKKGFVSLNYLVMPGFTDRRDEITAFTDFISAYKVDMIQWRNLNYDPVLYFKELNIPVSYPHLIGIKDLIGLIGRKFPAVMKGYFNPSKKRIERNLKR